MRSIILASTIVASFALQAATPDKQTNVTFDKKMNGLLQTHYMRYKDKEYFSGITVSVYSPTQPIKNYYIGKASHQEDSRVVDETTLFEIGSITKSFTAALMLQLEKENKLKLSDTLGAYLPEYSKWSTLSLRSLLNMTSGLPNYSDSPLMNAGVYNHPDREWSDKELLNFVYPPAAFSPPLKSGYAYTNTGYILSSLIIEKISQDSFQSEMQKRLLLPAKLTNTFYPIPEMDQSVYERLASGYAYNPYANPELVGKDMKSSSLSWAGAAGALFSTSEDVIKWVKTLLLDETILDKAQKQRMMQLVSTTSGLPLKQTTAADPRGFGLGIIQAYDKSIGNFWFYEGETEGYRALYMYVPSKGIIIASIFNSAVNAENDHASELMKGIYGLMTH